MSTAMDTIVYIPDWMNLIGSSGIFDLGSDKVRAFLDFCRLLSTAAAVGFVVWRGIKTGGAISAIVVAGMAAGVFIWIVFNVTSIKDRIGNEVNAVGPPVVQIAESAAPPPMWAGDRA